MHSQGVTKTEFIEKYQRAFQYTLDVAEAMPAARYDYRPSDSIFTFAEQVNHAVRTVGRHTSTYYLNLDSIRPDLNMDKDITGKAPLIEGIRHMESAILAILINIPDSEWTEREIEFFSGTFPLDHFFQILLDHLTHHRAMAIVYLRMQGITPPRYVGW